MNALSYIIGFWVSIGARFAQTGRATRSDELGGAEQRGFWITLLSHSVFLFLYFIPPFYSLHCGSIMVGKEIIHTKDSCVGAQSNYGEG